MLRIAIIGCGKIADSHASQIQRIPGCEIVGACDKEELMAKQLCDRFGVKRHFTNVSDLLDELHPDIVHITVPPHHHLEIGTECLEKGCNIYVEKPFTLHTTQAEKLIALADEKQCKLTVGHDAQFSEVARAMRILVGDGFLGGPPVHLESLWCYDFGDVTYAKTLLADKHHWARNLPGGLLHNIISHGVSKIAEFLTSETPRIIADGYVSPFLKKLGEHKLVDELRVIIREDTGTTAYFTFSSQMRPSLHKFRVYGPENGLEIDEDQRMLIKLRGNGFKSYANYFIPPVLDAVQRFGNLFRNGRLFLANDFHMDSSKYHLTKAFYNSITDDAPVPIPYREILLTSRIMDTIFEQLAQQNN